MKSPLNKNVGIDKIVDIKEDVFNKIQEVEQFVSSLKEMSFEEKQNVYDEALRKVIPKIIRMLESNYYASGLKVRTGTLLDNIRNANIYIFFKNKNPDCPPELAIKFPKKGQVKEYEKGGSEKVYAMANALNEGAVYNLQDTSLYFKKKIKKSAKKKSSEVIGGQIIDFMNKRGRTTDASAKGSKDNKQKSVKVIDGYEYFKLDRSQLQQISAEIKSNVDKIINS